MIAFINNLEYNLYRQKLLGGNVTGLWEEDSFFIGASSYPVMRYQYITAQFNNFEKNIFKDDMDMNYHLSGYGAHYNEALVSFLGESSERYAFTVLHKNIAQFVETASYQEVITKYPNDKILPLDLINVYFNKESSNYLLETDKIQWVPLTSLFNPEIKVFIPLQIFVLYSKDIFKNEKRITNSAVSTGTASHETFERAMKNAIIEVLQIDSFNMWWYTGLEGRELSVNVEEKIHQWFDDSSLVSKFISKFDITFTDISYDKAIIVVVCEIKSKNQDKSLPKYVVGVQGGTNLDSCIYRSFLECLTVLEYTMTMVWVDEEHYKEISADISTLSIDNLDDNVVYYAKYGIDAIARKTQKYTLSSVDKVDSLTDIIKSVKDLSQYAGYMDITPPEFYGKNMQICRTIIPELLPVCLPSFPPFYHPRYKDVGGIINNVPHPMA